jgi:transposase
MSEEIELGGIKVPAADLEATPESIKLVLKFLVEERKQTLAKIEALEERVNKNSKNSSIPPSKNGLGVKSSHKITAKRKPLKLQSRRVKQERKLYEAAECVATHEFKPSNCSNCGYELTGEDSHPKRHQIVDLPVLKPLITEYRFRDFQAISERSGVLEGDSTAQTLTISSFEWMRAAKKFDSFYSRSMVKAPLLRRN